MMTNTNRDISIARFNTVVPTHIHLPLHRHIIMQGAKVTQIGFTKNILGMRDSRRFSGGCYAVKR